MGQFHYPEVPTARHSTPLVEPSELPDSRHFSWVPASRRGGVRTMLPTDLPLPPLPAQTHQSPVQHISKVSNPEIERHVQVVHSLFPAHSKHTPQQDGAVSPARSYTQHKRYVPSNEASNTLAVKLQTEYTLASCDRFMSTRSMKAPEVVAIDTTMPLPKQAIVVEPDENPLTPSHTNFVSSPIQVKLPMYFPSNSPKEQLTERGGTWKHALCSCADTSTCLTGLFCPCIVYGKTQHRLGLRSNGKDPTNMLGYSWINGSCVAFAVLCGCNALLAAIQHTRVRKGYDMAPEAGNVMQDCAQAVCYCCCTLAQDEKEMKWRETGAKKLNSTGYQAVGGMNYAPPRR